MRTADLITRSMNIIIEYYDNNLEPFFDSLSDDVLWLGPAERQMIRGKKELIETFTQEKHHLTFTMGDIKATSIAPRNHVLEVVLRYDITTHYPTGTATTHSQRLHYTWRERRERTEDGWRSVVEIAMLDISNIWEYDVRDTIYPVHYEAVTNTNRQPAKPPRFVLLKAVDGSIYRILVDHIVFIETVKRSTRLLVHTKNATITVNGTLPEFEKRYPDDLVRIHASYLINPAAMRSIRRFSVTMSNGARLPIPEKKYTAVKKLLLDLDT